MAFPRFPEICRVRVMFQSLKSSLSDLESFQVQAAIHKRSWILFTLDY